PAGSARPRRRRAFARAKRATATGGAGSSGENSVKGHLDRDPGHVARVVRPGRERRCFPEVYFMEDADMRGRYPSGPEYVNRLDGSARAKERLLVVLQTMVGKYRVQEACQLLGICEQRFDQLREQALQAALRELEGKPGGRPRREQTLTREQIL